MTVFSLTLSLQSNDFELFAVPEQFAQERAIVDARWKELQREAHPDKFAAQGQAAQRIAMQWSVRINEAYQRLKDPLKRAAYLCELRGAPINAETNTAMPAEFLLEQMEWRETLAEASDLAGISLLEARLNDARRQLQVRIEKLLDASNDAAAAAEQVRALMFIERFGQDVAQRAAQLGQ